MAKRNRAREIAKFGQPVGERLPANMAIGVVTEEDLLRTVNLTSWLFEYVNHIYENGGPRGQRLDKGFSDVVGWLKLRKTYQDQGLDITAFARRRDLDWPGIRSEKLDDYLRQMRDGLEFTLDMNEFVNADDSRSTAEHTELIVSADGQLVSGSYSWYGPDEALRITPNARFNGPEEAHAATVTGRLAAMLTTFVEYVSDPYSGIDVTNTYNPDLTYLVPDSLRV